MSINNKIERIWELNRQGKRESAWALLKELMDENSENGRLWYLQGVLYARDKNYEKAFESIDKAIKLTPDQCAAYYFQRGLYNIDAGDMYNAIGDFSKAINSNDHNIDITLTEMLYFHRAEAYIKLGKKQEALSDLSHVSDGYQTWTFALRSKDDLLADCKNLP